MQRTYGQGHVDNRFVHEDPAIDQPPTEITAAWLNAVQEELVAVVHGADMVLNPENNGQVFAAITALINAAIVGGTVTESAKWAAMPLGHAQPFIPSVMGSSISDWLAAHPSWRKLDNSYVPDIEGRAMAISSGGHVSGSQAGNDDAVTVDHGHATNNPAHNHTGSDPGHSHGVTDPGHAHGITTKTGLNGLAGGAGIWAGEAAASTGTSATGISINANGTGISINPAATSVTVVNTGVSGINKNIQRTQYLDWIIKIS